MNIFRPRRGLYTIPQGKHRSGYYFKPHFGRRKFRFIVEFDKSAIYDTSNGNDHKNKAFGISWGYHHSHSWRLGFTYYQHGSIRFYHYMYINGVRKEVFINTFSIHNKIECCVELLESNMLQVRVRQPEIDAFWDYKLFDFSTIKTTWGYHLFPYFGGKNVAPHDFNIYFKPVLKRRNRNIRSNGNIALRGFNFS